jgi:hypothetical protein
MGSRPTLAAPARRDHAPTDPAIRAGEATFAWLNPEFDRFRFVPPQRRRSAPRTFEQQQALGLRVLNAWIDENLGPASDRAAAIGNRAVLAGELATDRAVAARVQAEAAFDRLNPAFGVPADTRDLAGKRAMRDREAGLALGTRAAVAAARENDPNPVIHVAGQDYRAADAARTTRLGVARQRHGPERAGPER